MSNYQPAPQNGRRSSTESQQIPTSSTSAIETIDPLTFQNEPSLRETVTTDLGKLKKRKQRRQQENRSPSRGSSALSTTLNTKQKGRSDFASYN